MSKYQTAVQKSYPKAECPDCGTHIPKSATNGSECKNCGHVFWSVKPKVIGHTLSLDSVDIFRLLSKSNPSLKRNLKGRISKVTLASGGKVVHLPVSGSGFLMEIFFPGQ